MTSHEGYVIQNPDGSSAVLVPEVKPPLHPMNPPAMAQLPNPYAQLDALAQQELARMRKQDNSDLAALSTTPKDLQEIYAQSAHATKEHATYQTYNGPRPKDDAQLAAAVAAVDASVQRAVAMAAGGGPTAIPEGPLGAVNRNDWLERMRAQDEMLKAAVAKHDTSLHST